MSYFSVSKRWYYHHIPGHHYCQATQGGAYVTDVQANSAMAAVGGGEDSDNDFITFIGWIVDKIFCYVIVDPVRWGLVWLFTSLETVLLGFLIEKEMVMEIITLQ